MTGPGRPTLYKPEHASRARELCARGATNPDLAGRFGVARSTIGQWIATHPEFAEAVQQGRDVADATAVESLFTRVHRLQPPGREGLPLSRRAQDGDLHRACSARNQGLHVLAAQPPAGGLAGEGGNDAGGHRRHRAA
jgi:hypothetical protein